MRITDSLARGMQEAGVVVVVVGGSRFEDCINGTLRFSKRLFVFHSLSLSSTLFICETR